MRVPAFLLALMTATTALAGACAGPPAPVQNAKTAPDETVNLNAAGEFSADDPGAIAYDRKLAPQGAQASVTIESGDGQTRTSLVVEGLLPGRRYGAHLHTKPCGRKPDDAGPHYQHHPGRIDADSEVWLDFTTDDEGAGRSSARNDWMLERAKLPGSLVIHSQPTTTSGPEVGQAGARVACLTLK
ncbi:Cu-Zn family superoxide dismutase [Nonomuraea thailandensis]|uniref:Cu-Zn family superoxide dismutase n=1 Tax=Nonomuraea thailandensis TaxID=1188745 RepID=A0A9X2GWF9_9ACTN|nr:superoxide dismutase family protein [Nonomuraea thailandensis]MCP2365180.1 Cu-Zn family superoxide dismutase [Nonomuraea thailandensis]